MERSVAHQGDSSLVEEGADDRREELACLTGVDKKSPDKRNEA